MLVGVVAVQGAFIEHEKMLESLGIGCVELRKKSDITENHIDGLILPGGESTVQGKLLRELDMLESIKDMIDHGIPVLATCAGLILLSKRISGDVVVHLGTLPVTVKRNAYGRQLGSFVRKSLFEGLGDFEMTFIRAPYIEEINDPLVKILATVDGKIVGVRYKNQLAMAFHPEMGKDLRIHQLFLSMMQDQSNL
ncbi:MAG: pyridoxal 5'-phosphate synthase glutaminase subunit PdxT [Treponema sp.]|nr:pyridoxal 5'-phosphate synthase glutaminase subunit PdxT [Treponema sp.]